MLKDCVFYREEVGDSTSFPEGITCAIEQAIRGSAPAQFNIPGDMLTKVHDVELHACETPERPPGGPKSTLVAPSVQHDFLVALVAPSVGPKSTLLELSNGHIQDCVGYPVATLQHQA